MISLGLEMDYCAALRRQEFVFSADDARAERERGEAVREVQRLQLMREQMRLQGDGLRPARLTLFGGSES